MLVITIFALNSCYEEHLQKAQNIKFEKDTIYILSHLYTDSAKKYSVNLELNIVNLKKDTVLLIPNPFFLVTKESSINNVWVLSNNEFTCPNIMYIRNDNHDFIFESDGKFIIKYDIDSPIYFIPPNDSISFRIQLKLKILNDTTLKNIKYFGSVIYTEKTSANFLSNNSEYPIKQQFDKNLKYAKEVYINPYSENKIIQSLNDRNMNENKMKYSKFIRDTFNKKIGF